MEQNKKGALLLGASIVGFAYWIVFILSGFGISEFQTQIGFWEGFLNFIKRVRGLRGTELKGFLLYVLFLAAIIASPVLNLIGWKKNSKMMVIIAIPFYLLSLNALSLLLCVISILWNSKDDFSIQGKKKNLLFIIAGIFGILGLALRPVLFNDSLFSALLLPISNTMDLVLRVAGLNYVIALIMSFVISITISFFGRLRRNNAKKALIAAVLYIISLSIPSAILCFIGFLILKRQKSLHDKKQLSLELSGVNDQTQAI
jgi:hypothetical protein